MPGVEPLRIGCSGWNYADWRERVYPKGTAAAPLAGPLRDLFDTVEVNTTFYRLAKPTAVATWVAERRPDFVFAVKASQYLTHMKRLRDIEQGIGRFYAAIAPLAESTKLGPCAVAAARALQARRARAWPTRSRILPPGRHCFEFRHPIWFTDDVFELLRGHGVALGYGDHPQRPWQPLELTTDWTFLRFHYGERGRRGNYSETELREWAPRVAELRARAEVFAYFNNDWEGFAVAQRAAPAAAGVGS